MATPPKPKVQVFGNTETMDDATAEQEELQGAGKQQESPPELPSPSEETTEPAPKEEGTPEAPPEKETRGKNRVEQLLQERYELQRQLTEERERWARLDERTKQIKEAREVSQQAQEAAQRPDSSIDPLGAELWDTKKALNELVAWRQQQEQQFAQLQNGFTQNQQEQYFNNTIVAEANTYARAQPDYPDAAKYLADWRRGLLQNMGYSPEEAQQIMLAEANVLIRGNIVARQQGRTAKAFPEILYEAAKQVGYQVRNGNTPTAAQTSAAGRVLAQAAKGQAMQGIGKAGGAEPQAGTRYRNYSKADIAAMSEDEWSRATRDPRAWAELQEAMKEADGIAGQDVRYFTR